MTSSDESAEKQQSQTHMVCPVCWLFSAKSFLTSKIFEVRSDDVVALMGRHCGGVASNWEHQSARDTDGHGEGG